MEKTDYLKNGPSYILPKIKYVISEPHGDLLHWNLSCSLTFNFLVHQEGCDQLGAMLWDFELVWLSYTSLQQLAEIYIFCFSGFSPLQDFSISIQ